MNRRGRGSVVDSIMRATLRCSLEGQDHHSGTVSPQCLPWKICRASHFNHPWWWTAFFRVQWTAVAWLLVSFGRVLHKSLWQLKHAFVFDLFTLSLFAFASSSSSLLFGSFSLSFNSFVFLFFLFFFFSGTYHVEADRRIYR